MNRIIKVTLISFCTLLAIVLYLLLTPITICQAIYLGVAGMVTDKDMFIHNDPISTIVAERVIKYAC